MTGQAVTRLVPTVFIIPVVVIAWVIGTGCPLASSAQGTSTEPITRSSMTKAAPP